MTQNKDEALDESKGPKGTYQALIEKIGPPSFSLNQTE